MSTKTGYKNTDQYKMLNGIWKDCNDLLVTHIINEQELSEYQSLLSFRKGLTKISETYISNISKYSDNDIQLLFNRYKRDYNALFKSSPNITNLLDNYTTNIYTNTFTAVQNGIISTIITQTGKNYNKMVQNISTLVSNGNLTRKQAVKNVLNKYNGPTVMFSDGRNYPAKAYFETVIQDTQMQVSRELGQDLANDLDTDIFVYSERTPALVPRDVCVQLGGKLVAMGWSGSIRDGNGKLHDVLDLYAFGYGSASGALGIRCGHDIFPFIEGVSIM